MILQEREINPKHSWWMASNFWAEQGRNKGVGLLFSRPLVRRLAFASAPTEAVIESTWCTCWTIFWGARWECRVKKGLPMDRLKNGIKGQITYTRKTHGEVWKKHFWVWIIEEKKGGGQVEDILFSPSVWLLWKKLLSTYINKFFCQ